MCTIVRHACAFSRVPFAAIRAVVSDDPPRAAYDSNSNGSSDGSDGVGGRETRTSRSRTATAGVAFAEDTDEGWLEGERGRRSGSREAAEATGTARKGGGRGQ